MLVHIFYYFSIYWSDTSLHLELLSFKGGCTGSSESTLVKMPPYWKSHATAHLRTEQEMCSKL